MYSLQQDQGKDQGKQEQLGTTVDTAMKFHDLGTFAEIDSCTLTFLLACRNGEKSFCQMASLHYYMAVLLAVQPAYDQVNQETTSLH